MSTFDAAVLEFLRHGRKTLELIDQAEIAGAPVSRTEAFRGLAMLLLARPELEPAIRTCLSRAEVDLALMPDLLGAALTKGLRSGLDQGRRAAARQLETYPWDLDGAVLPFKLAYQLRFMTGDVGAMATLSERYLIAAVHDHPGASFAQGCLAFALEEQGYYEDALTCASAAIAFDPLDAWAAHVISHVFEMSGLPEDGLEWSEAVRPHFSHCNNFRYHMEWHHGLFLIRLNQYAEALEHYDVRIRPEPTDDYRDFANASSYLARLKFHGVDVQNRWEELRGQAQTRAHELELGFAAVHRALVFVCTNDVAGAEDVRAAMEELSQRDCEQGEVARSVGLPLILALLSLSGPESRVPEGIDQLARRIPQLGGSNAQREVFLEALIHLLGQAGATSEAVQVAKIREEVACPPLLRVDTG